MEVVGASVEHGESLHTIKEGMENGETEDEGYLASSGISIDMSFFKSNESENDDKDETETGRSTYGLSWLKSKSSVLSS